MKRRAFFKVLAAIPCIPLAGVVAARAEMDIRQLYPRTERVFGSMFAGHDGPELFIPNDGFATELADGTIEVHYTIPGGGYPKSLAV